MKIIISLIICAALTGISNAKTWGPATVANPGFDRAKALDEVFRELATAPNEPVSRVIADRMWLIFMQAPDEETAENMNRALRARGGYNFDKALGFLNTIIDSHPTYAEGWNQRSYIHFLKKDYDKALTDCERGLALEPRHLGCLSGMARILIRHQKRYLSGKALLQRAMKLHPWIHERVLLKEIPETEL